MNNIWETAQQRGGKSTSTPASRSLLERTRRFRVGLAVAAGFAIVAAPQAADAAGPVVKIAGGNVQGFIQNNVATFLGIPYAAPPVKSLRWAPPQPAAAWSNTLQATSFGPTCAQITTLGVFAGPANNNEDCLYANVFTPNLQANAGLPVIVWIHGGGNLDGESSDYDGTKMATEGNTVVVTFNYRLNLMGFLSVASLDGEGHNFSNYGLLDQQMIANAT